MCLCVTRSREMVDQIKTRPKEMEDMFMKE